MDIGDILRKLKEASEDGEDAKKKAKRYKQLLDNDYEPLYVTLPKKRPVEMKENTLYRTKHGEFMYIIGRFPFEQQVKFDNLILVKTYEWVGFMVDEDGFHMSQAFMYDSNGYAFDRRRVVGEIDNLEATDLVEEIPSDAITLGVRGNCMQRAARSLEEENYK